MIRVFLQARRRPLLGYTGHSDFVPAPLPSLDRVRADDIMHIELVVGLQLLTPSHSYSLLVGGFEMFQIYF
jgi:hypothetical protein